jgi:hypothetical protein
MNNYRELMFTIDGTGWVFDNESETIKEVWDKHNEMGSRWFFYPIPLVIRGKMHNTNFKYHKIVSTCEGLEFLKGKSINTARKFIMNNQDYIQSLVS